MVIQKEIDSLITDKEEKKKLRDHYRQEYLRLTGKELSCSERIFSRTLYKPKARKHLVDITCSYFKIEKEELLKKTRKREIVKVKQFMTFFCLNIKMTWNEIVRVVGLADHSIVAYSLKAMKSQIEVDKEFAKEYKDYEIYCDKVLKSLMPPKREKLLDKHQEKAIVDSYFKGGITQQELAEIYGVGRTVIYNLIKPIREAKQEKIQWLPI